MTDLVKYHNTTARNAVTTDAFAQLTRAAKVDDLDGRAFGVAEQDVLRLEVAMNNVEFGRREEQQRCAQLLRKLARKVQRDAAEVCIAQQVVQVVGKQLEDQTQV